MPALTTTTTSYAATAYGAQRRIRSPNHNDVLSGRGGGINSHPGNRIFREWVKARKEEYNLSGSKAEKAKIANEVIALVKAQNPPGRFLQRGTSSVTGPTWWLELDESKALSKTSQALREGAPKIRAEHQDELEERGIKVPVRRNSKKRSAPTTGSTDDVAASIRDINESIKRHKASSQEHVFMYPEITEQQEPTPVTMVSPVHQPVESPSIDDIPPLVPTEEQPQPAVQQPAIPPMTPWKRLDSTNNEKLERTNFGLPRMHSLILSDISTGEGLSPIDEEFVNPFDNEHDIFYSQFDRCDEHDIFHCEYEQL